MRPRLTYANVMSTIAMFAAVATGTGYAATQLGANSVRSTHIVNGQVAYVDLHPDVKRRIGAGATTSSTPLTTAWTTVLSQSGRSLYVCQKLECPSRRTTGDGSLISEERAGTGVDTIALTKLVALPDYMVQIQHRMTVTNGGNLPLGIRTDTLAVDRTGQFRELGVGCSSDELAPGETKVLTCNLGEWSGTYLRQGIQVKTTIYGRGTATDGSSGALLGDRSISIRRQPF